MKKALLIVGSLLLAVGTANAEQIVKPRTFTAGTPANADEVNSNFDVVYDQVNKLGAAINVDVGNRVGIGTDSPAGELHVTRPQVVSPVIFTGAAGGDNLSMDTSTYNGIGTTSYAVRVENAGPAVDVIEYSSDGGATWSTPVDMNVSGLHIGNNVTIGFASTDGHAWGDTWEWTVTQGFANGLIVADGKVTVKEIAILGVGYGAGRVLTSDVSGNATWQAAAPDADNDPANEIQDISVVGTDLTISGGSTVSIADNDNDPANELQTISLNGPEITLSHNGGFVTLNDDSAVNELQAISRTGNNVTLSQGGGTVSVADDDSSPSNELQTISRTGDTVTLSNGGGSVSVADNDSSITNEIQTLSLSGSTISLTSGGSVTIDASGVNELNSSVSMSGTTLSVTDPGGVKSVDLAEKLSLGNLSNGREDSFSLFLGSGAGASDDGLNFNTGVGRNVLSANTSGENNNAFGYEALKSNTTGFTNSAIGPYALTNNSTGNYNVALGSSALRYNTTGSSNLALGIVAGGTNQTGSRNVFLGFQAGYTETGSDKLYIDSSSTPSPLIYGDFANDALTVNGSLDVVGNAAVGPNASVDGVISLNVRGDASDNTTGYFSNIGTAVFNYAVSGNAKGVGGAQHFGLYGYAEGGTSYNIGVYGTANGTGAYAGYFVGDVHATGNITAGGTITPSDVRLKENIRPVENGLEKVSAINGVYYNMIDNPEQTEVGVIAQDVQKVLPEAVRVIDQENGYLGVSYPSLIPVLIEAVKELKAENEALKADNAVFKELLCQDHPEAAICK